MDTYEILLRVKRTLAQMMRDRGFVLGPDALLDAAMPVAFEYEDLLAFFKRLSARKKGDMTFMDALRDTFVRTKKNGDEETWTAVFVMNDENKRLGKGDVQPFLAQLADGQVEGGMLISSTGLTPQAQDTLDAVKDRRIQHFTFDQLLFNPTHHVLTPYYLHVSDPDEVAAFFKTNRVKPRQMPIMLATDPIARYFGARSGDLFEETTEMRGVPQMVQKTTTVRYVV